MINYKKVKTLDFSDLKQATESISIRFPKWLLDKIKTRANRMDVPYQSLIKVYLADKLSDIKRQYKTKKL